MVFKFTKVVPDGHTKWFTTPVTSNMTGAVAKVSATFDGQSIERGLDRIASQRTQDLAAADPAADTIYYMIGEPEDHMTGSSMPVTTYFKTRPRRW